FVLVGCTLAHVPGYLLCRSVYHSLNIAGNTGILDGDILLAKHTSCLLVFERDANSQNSVVIALLNISETGYSWRVIIYIAFYNQCRGNNITWLIGLPSRSVTCAFNF